MARQRLQPLKATALLSAKRGDHEAVRYGIASAVSDIERLSAIRERQMSAKTTKFLTDWLRWHVVGRIASTEDIPLLVSKCLADARREGISSAELECAVGSVEDCIRQSLLKVRK